MEMALLGQLGGPPCDDVGPVESGTFSAFLRVIASRAKNRRIEP